MSSQQTGHCERKIHKTEVHTTIHQKMSFQQDVNLSALKVGGGCSELSREGENTKKIANHCQDNLVKINRNLR